MKKPTQEERVVKQMLKQGYITRNQCLGTFPCISRLGAIIANLKGKGWQFDTKDIGKDYIYTPTKTPYKTVTYTLSDGRVLNKLTK